MEIRSSADEEFNNRTLDPIESNYDQIRGMKQRFSVDQNVINGTNR